MKRFVLLCSLKKVFCLIMLFLFLSVFAKAEYDVFVNPGKAGSVKVTTNNDGSVSLMPYAEAGYVFRYYRLSSTSDGGYNWFYHGQYYDVPVQISFSKVSDRHDLYQYGFYFAKSSATYTITVKSNNTSYGTVTGGGTYVINASAIIQAEPGHAYQFTQWSDGNTDNPRIVIVTEDKEYTAVFDLIKYSVKFVDADGVQIGDTQILEEGQSATPPTPPAREGYTFVGWIGKYTSVNKNATIYASYYKNSDIPELQQGALQGLFSISATQQVHFSQGNLQYLASTNTWRFAENQYDIAGSTSNASISSSHNDWIDLFGWGTSGWNSGANAYLPYSTSTTEADYVPGNNIANNLKDAYAKADWGVYNAMYNGGGVAGVWRTLTIDEWEYLCFHRENAEAKRSLATVNNIPGYILLPDDWKLPAGISFTENTSNSTTNIYDKAQWQKMEANGAIFLPTAGYRNGVEVYSEKSFGDYWLATSYDANNANRFYFRKDRMFDISASNEQRHYGFSVRLVYPPTFAITVNSADSSMGSATGGGTYSSGSTQTIQATPNDCYQFTKWSDGNTDNPRTIIVDGDATYTAIFEKDTYTITVEPADETQGTVTIELVDDTPSTQGIGTFSVSATKQVTFSPGNLQYHPANDEWRFAESQLDYIGKANSNCSSTYNGWLDLFGWSTSATHFGVSTSTDYNDYSGSFVDWGTNKIGNDAPNTWRTLTFDEWNYLLKYRNNASSLCGVAQVNGVNGLIFLPDNWICPVGVTFKSGFYNSNHSVDYYAAHQTFTADQWSKLEAAGAVFLPAACSRSGSTVYYVQGYGDYWSASENLNINANFLDFGSDEAGMYNTGRYHGMSVRLVKDLR